MQEAELATRRRLAWLEASLLDPAQFPHEEHVRLVFELLRRHDFVDAVARFAGGVRRMTARVGKPQAFHVTITIAFASLIVERMEAAPDVDWDTFRDANPDLFRRDALLRLYTRERLSDEHPPRRLGRLRTWISD